MSSDGNKYAIFTKRTENEMISRKGRQIDFGSALLEIKPLFWLHANEFEDELMGALRKIGTLTSLELNESGMEQIVTKVVGLLQDDLLSLAGKATRGAVCLESVQEYEATKEDVIKVIVTAIDLNYAYLRNFINLSAQLK